MYKPEALFTIINKQYKTSKTIFTYKFINKKTEESFNLIKNKETKTSKTIIVIINLIYYISTLIDLLINNLKYNRILLVFAISIGIIISLSFLILTNTKNNELKNISNRYELIFNYSYFYIDIITKFTLIACYMIIVINSKNITDLFIKNLYLQIFIILFQYFLFINCSLLIYLIVIIYYLIICFYISTRYISSNDCLMSNISTNENVNNNNYNILSFNDEYNEINRFLSKNNNNNVNNNTINYINTKYINKINANYYFYTFFPNIIFVSLLILIYFIFLNIYKERKINYTNIEIYKKLYEYYYNIYQNNCLNTLSILNNKVINYNMSFKSLIRSTITTSSNENNYTCSKIQQINNNNNNINVNKNSSKYNYKKLSPVDKNLNKKVNFKNSFKFLSSHINNKLFAFKESVQQKTAFNSSYNVYNMDNTKYYYNVDNENKSDYSLYNELNKIKLNHKKTIKMIDTKYSINESNSYNCLDSINVCLFKGNNKNNNRLLSKKKDISLINKSDVNKVLENLILIDVNYNNINDNLQSIKNNEHLLSKINISK